ncbi:histidine kinase, partial [Vibrio sp. 10N.222.46.A3]
LQLLIQDDGVGFNTYKAMEKRGIGLFIGGDFELMSEVGFGTEITVLLTLEGLVNE